MGPPIIIYSFRSGGFARNGDSVLCVGEAPLIEAALGPGAVEKLFFGCVRYRDDGGPDFIGVWGARNASRLRRLLREAGAELLVYRRPPPARLRYWSSGGKTRFEARRRARKIKLARELLLKSRPYPML